MVAAAYRRTAGQLEPLELGPKGFRCSEGEVVVVCTRTLRLPTLTMCGETLVAKAMRQDGESFFAEFERFIDTWAGRTKLVLEGDGKLETLHLDIDPHGKKLGPGVWDSLIEELSRISTSLPWGLSPGGAEGRMTPDALATVHPAIIENLLPPFLRLLQQFIGSPPLRTVRTRTVRPLDVTRAADLRTIRSLSRRPLELAGLRGLSPEAYSPNARTLIDQPDVRSTFDHPVTRYVAFLIQKIRRRLLSTVRSLRSPAGHGFYDEAARTYARQLANSVDRALREIQEAQKARVFRGIQPEGLSDTTLQVLPDHPLYLAIYRVGRRLAEPGLAFAPGQSVVSALKHSFDLFELTVLYRLVAALGDALGPSWRPLSSSPLRRHPHEDRPPDRSIWSWTGPRDESVELVYQALFNAAASSASSDGFASISGQYVPDFVIIYRRKERPVSWIILDAKYRSSRKPIHDGLGDIHRYRDALRVSQRPADAAYIIVPALEKEAALYGTQGYRQAYGFGAISIHEKDWVSPIRDWLARERSNQAHRRIANDRCNCGAGPAGF
jgi:hypothetical protein